MRKFEMEKMPTPFEYYRKYRPEYFSDTKVVYKSTLKEEQFQYIMDRLSNDMKQDLFENLTKQPETTENIDRFRDSFEKCHKCGISAVAFSTNLDDTLYDKEKRFNMIIPVKNVVFREAWEVGVNDMDSSTILPDDEPIIPEEHKSDAPVIELLKKKKK